MKSCLRRWSVSRVDNFWEVRGHILRSEGNCPLVSPRSANPVRINKGTATARTVEEVCAIQFVKVFHTRLLRSKLLESYSFSALSGQMRNVSSLARVRSETRRRRDFSQEWSIKIWKFNIRCVAFSGSSTLFYRWFSSELMDCVLPTPVEIFIYTRPHRACHQHHGILSFYHPHAQDRTVGHGETLWFRLLKLKSPKIRL